jgi:hypothetical protein
LYFFLGAGATKGNSCNGKKNNNLKSIAMKKAGNSYKNSIFTLIKNDIRWNL